MLRRFYWYLRGIVFRIIMIFIRKREQPDPADINKVLIIALSRIGDAVYATPVVRELKRSHPEITLDVLCRPYTAGVFRHNPHIHTLLLCKNGIIAFFRTLLTVKKKHYDFIIDLTSDHKVAGALLSRLGGPSYCIGFNTQKRGFCLDRALPLPAGEIHITRVYLGLLEALENGKYENHPEIVVCEEEKREIHRFLERFSICDSEVIVGLHPGAHFSTQRLPEQKWAALCDRIQESFQKKVVVFGGPREITSVQRIQQLAALPLIIVDGLPDLRAAVALIDRCNVLLCNNSGPLHIAEALGTPTLSWMGPTVPYRWYPVGPHHRVIRKDIDCSPCNRASCGRHSCAVKITPGEMETAFRQLLDSVI